MIKPCVVARAGNIKDSAHHLDAELNPMRFDEPIRLPCLALLWTLCTDIALASIHELRCEIFSKKS
jgi:hypothetical protein